MPWSSRVGEIIPADVMVHMEPRAAAGEHLFDRIRAIAARRGLSVHELSAHQIDGRLFVEMHLEVPEQLSLRDAHRRASELEEEIRTLGDVSAPATGAAPIVNIHIEPLGTHIAAVDGQRGEMTGLGRAIEDYINTLPEYHELVDCHEVRVRQVEHKILASCHCAMDGNRPITQVHDVTTALEDRVKERFPQVARVPSTQSLSKSADRMGSGVGSPSRGLGLKSACPTLASKPRPCDQRKNRRIAGDHVTRFGRLNCCQKRRAHQQVCQQQCDAPKIRRFERVRVSTAGAACVPRNPNSAQREGNVQII